jgi:hypothetical protein
VNYMPDGTRKPGTPKWVLSTCGFLLVLAFWIGQSYLEAAAFERITGKEVSLWDAMFLSLRIQG